jgi:hypothetical protein
MLDFVYTSHVDDAYYDKDCFSIYAMAVEYQLMSMQDVARMFIVSSLTVNSVKATLQLALLHKDTTLSTRVMHVWTISE